MKILAKNVKKEFIEVFEQEIEKIPEKIKEMLKKRGVDFVIVDYIDDLYDEQRLKKHAQIYKDDITRKKTTRGLMSDESHCIALSSTTTKIKDIKAILYHELGHFLDAYDNYGKVDELGLSLSSRKEFVDAYTKDFIAHYDKIKENDNFRLVHFIQKSTPENISNIGIIETFAELFRWANNIKNDSLTVELYFPTALRVAKKLINERFEFEF